MADFDELIEIEDLLRENLRGQSDIDGHESGPEGSTIFIDTDEPEECFQQVKSLLGGCEAWPTMTVAYRELPDGDYMTMWPLKVI